MTRALLLIALLAGCDSKSSSLPPDPAQEMAQKTSAAFFTEWFKGHGHEEVVSDEHGVGIAGNATRLKAGIYKRESLGNTNATMLEVEFRITLPDGREIIEYLAGVGDTDEEAMSDALLNFTLTTFHVIYRAFIDPDDPHMTEETVLLNGKERKVLFGDVFMRGGDESVDISAINTMLKTAVGQHVFTDGTHWLKIVYAQMDGKPNTIAVTLDNEDASALTAAVTALKWPGIKGFYMVKQFIVVK